MQREGFRYRMGDWARYGAGVLEDNRVFGLVAGGCFQVRLTVRIVGGLDLVNAG